MHRTRVGAGLGARSGLRDRFDRIGIQRRIMLYVTVGLAAMFGGFAWLGFRAVEDAAQLVYEERLSTAYTTAGMMERDLLHVARDVEESFAVERGPDVAARLRDHLALTDPFPFFRVTGVWVLTESGQLDASAGEPRDGTPEQLRTVMSAATETGAERYAVISPIAPASADVPFATMVVRPTASANTPGVVVAVHAVSINTTDPYVPTTYWRSQARTGSGAAVGSESEMTYHLEVLDPAGTVVLGVGQDERPGATSRHIGVLGGIIARHEAAVIVHDPIGGEDFSAHAMAVVPLGSSGFYLVLEQPTDVALSLPMDLRRSVTLAAILGFLGAISVAWITTRHVTRPTEQLTAAAQRMARGDLESPIRVTAQDEVGRLAENLDAMRGQLRDAYRQVSEANERLEGQVAERTARLTDLLSKVISAQEEERRRLARELHDETAQTIGALAIALDRTRRELRGSPPEAGTQLREAEDIVQHLLEETRRLILDLRPAALEDLGLVPAIRWYAETHLDDEGVRTTIDPGRAPAVRLEPHLEVTLFRIAQEAINNIARHAEARRATISLSFTDTAVRIAVTDDGRGFDVDRAMSSPGDSVGLMGLHERARLLNGRMEIRSEHGKGTRLAVEVPIAFVPGAPV